MVQKIKQVVIKRSVGKWYVCLQLEAPDPEPVVNDGRAVGVDVGLLHLLALSDGSTVENPRWLRKSLTTCGLFSAA